MEKFKGDLKKRLVFMILGDLLAICLIAREGYFFNNIRIVMLGGYFNNIITAQSNNNVTNVISGYQKGIFMGIQVIILVYIKIYIMALKDKEKLRQLYIKENDERKKLIVSKFGGVGFNFCLAVIAIAAIIIGNFNQVAFVTLLIVALFMSFVKASLLIFYSHKI